MKMFKRYAKKITGCIFIILFLAWCTPPAWATPQLSKGQTLYVPVYSHIYIGHKAAAYMLTVTLSIRNIDPESSLLLTAVDYYDSEGKFIQHRLETPITLPPMGSTRYVVREPDKSGSSGANFIVKWTSMKMINPPIVESIMIGTRSQQGISFTSRGQEIAPH